MLGFLQDLILQHPPSGNPVDDTSDSVRAVLFLAALPHETPAFRKHHTCRTPRTFSEATSYQRRQTTARGESSSLARIRQVSLHGTPVCFSPHGRACLARRKGSVPSRNRGSSRRQTALSDRGVVSRDFERFSASLATYCQGDTFAGRRIPTAARFQSLMTPGVPYRCSHASANPSTRSFRDWRSCSASEAGFVGRSTFAKLYFLASASRRNAAIRPAVFVAVSPSASNACRSYRVISSLWRT